MDDTAILSNPKTAQNRVYVGGLAPEATPSLLNIKFSVHGKILGLSRKGPTFCFIEYNSEASAQKAIESENGTTFCGRKIVVKKTEMKSSPRKRKREDEDQIDGNVEELSGRSNDNSLAESTIHAVNSFFSPGLQYRALPVSDATPKKITHCAIIIVDESVHFYAETIKQAISSFDLKVEIIISDEFRETAKIMRSHGSLYAIQVNQYHQMTYTMTVAILSNVPREQQNISFDQGIKLIYQDFQQERTKRIPEDFSVIPENISKLLNKLFYNIRLTTLQYEQLISYLNNERIIQKELELGEPFENSLIVSNQTSSNFRNNNSTNSLQEKVFEILKRRSGNEQHSR